MNSHSLSNRIELNFIHYWDHLDNPILLLWISSGIFHSISTVYNLSDHYKCNQHFFLLYVLINKFCKILDTTNVALSIFLHTMWRSLIYGEIPDTIFSSAAKSIYHLIHFVKINRYADNVVRNWQFTGKGLFYIWRHSKYKIALKWVVRCKKKQFLCVRKQGGK